MVRNWCAGVLAAVVVATSLTAGGPAAAQDRYRDWNQAGDTLAGAVGLHYGKLGGHGLAFRVPMEWWLYLQVAGGIWHTSDKQRHNLGFELDYLLRQDQHLRVYVGGGAGYFYKRVKTGVSGGADQFAKDTNWNLGAGVGLEMLQGERWSWQIEADFVHDGRTDETTVVPQLGIYYYW